MEIEACFQIFIDDDDDDDDTQPSHKVSEKQPKNLWNLNNIDTKCSQTLQLYVVNQTWINKCTITINNVN